MKLTKAINGKREVWDLIVSDGAQEWAQAWGLATHGRAAEFSRSLNLLDGWTREIRSRWEVAS